jgi:hypothetical protein
MAHDLSGRGRRERVAEAEGRDTGAIPAASATPDRRLGSPDHFSHSYCFNKTILARIPTILNGRTPTQAPHGWPYSYPSCGARPANISRCFGVSCCRPGCWSAWPRWRGLSAAGRADAGRDPGHAARPLRRHGANRRYGDRVRRLAAGDAGRGTRTRSCRSPCGWCRTAGASPPAPRAARWGSPTRMTTASPPPMPLVIVGIACVAAESGATQAVALAVGCGAVRRCWEPVLTPVPPATAPGPPPRFVPKPARQASAPPPAPRGGSVTLSVTAIVVAAVQRSWPLSRSGWGTRTGRPHQPLLPPVIPN